MGRASNDELTFEPLEAKREQEQASVPLASFVAGQVHADLAETEARLSQLKADSAVVLDEQAMTFRISISSGWASYGEERTETVVTGTLREAMRQAALEFKAKNNRSDVQGSWYVTVLLPNGSAVSIPSVYWADLTRYGDSEMYTARPKVGEALFSLLEARPATQAELKAAAESVLDEIEKDIFDFDAYLNSLLGKHYVGWNGDTLVLTEDGLAYATREREIHEPKHAFSYVV